MRLVVDAGVAVKWFVPENLRPKALGLLAAAEAAGGSVVTADRRLAAAVSATRLADRVTRIEDLP